MSNELTAKTISLHDFDLHYSTAGNINNPALILIHPAFGDHQCFVQQIDSFSQKYYVILIDLPGHGRSQPNNTLIGIEHTPEYLAAILQNENQAQAHVLGVSLGSLIAQEFAYRYPHLVASVTVVGGYSIFGDQRAVLRAQRKEMFKWMFMVLFSIERFRRYVARISVFYPAGQELFYQRMQYFSRSSFRLMSKLNQIMHPNEAASKQQLLILVGEHDQPIALQAAREWQQQQPTIGYHVLPNAGHCANMDNPTLFNQLVLDFLL
ncbi:alpha/beta hydrolase [Herpetosiphon gulosus]|uniref:Dihydrolipoyllysine-residue acetyltransferase component of acetoin cleaving system n=1 Tax=Herpetosiphon gulosus TaxID=1973496 RepID=A0ABP9X3S7_9CHLR